MPVNDLGYRKWEGELSSPYWRWLTIAFAGIKIVYKSQWIKRIMFVAWGPALLVGLLFFFYEQYVENREKYAPEQLEEFNEFVDQDFDPEQIQEAIQKAKEKASKAKVNFMEQAPPTRSGDPNSYQQNGTQQKKASSSSIESPDRRSPNVPPLAAIQSGGSQRPPGPPPGSRQNMRPQERPRNGEVQGPNGRGPPEPPSFDSQGYEPQAYDGEFEEGRKGLRQYMQENRRYGGFEPMVGLLFVFASRSQVEILLESFTKEPNEARGDVWSFILLQMLRRTQGWMVLVLIGLITPPLISKDIRSRAFLFYFSKPISRTDYLLGKLAVVGFFVGFVTILPALALYIFGVVLSPSLTVVLSTWDLPFKVIAACLVSIVPACLIGLALSSMTSESRFAGFAWFMVWILGFVGYQIVNFVQRFQPDGRFIEEDIDSYWRMVSLYDCLGYLQGWVMGLETNHGYALVLLGFVVSICVFCVFVIMRNISSPMKA